MEHIRKNRLFYKVLILFVPFMAVAVFSTAVIFSGTGYRYFHASIQRDYSTIIKRSAGEIHLFMENARRQMEGLAALISAGRPEPWDLDMALTAFGQKFPEIISISLLGPLGRAELVSGVPSAVPAAGDEDVLKLAWSGKAGISGVKSNDVGIPYANIGVPVFRFGKVEKVLWAELSLKAVWDVLEGIPIGKTGGVYIADSSGRTIGHREMDRVVSRFGSNPALRQYLSGGDSEPVEWNEEQDGNRLYCMAFHIPDLNWTVVLYQPEEEIYDYLYKSVARAIALTVGLCLVAIVAGRFFVKNFLRPILDLHREVVLMGEGDLNRKVEVLRHDEIGELGEAFNRMAASLRGFVVREVETARELVHARNVATLGEASGKVTHEVGNLLNTLGIGLATFKAHGLPEGCEQTIRLMEENMTRVDAFIRNLLQFAKKPVLALQRIPLDGIIGDAIMVHAEDASRRGISITQDWPQDIPLIDADSRLIFQVVANLIKNALEAMDSPGEVCVTGALNGDFVEIRFRNSGSGIPPEIMEHVFDPFFTTKGENGTGLGLAVCRTVVEAHRGTIACRNENGAVFTVRLPLVQIV